MADTQALTAPAVPEPDVRVLRDPVQDRVIVQVTLPNEILTLDPVVERTYRQRCVSKLAELAAAIWTGDYTNPILRGK